MFAKIGPVLELEFVELGIVHGNAKHVGRQQVARELNAMEVAVERSRQRMPECGLADTRNVFDQQVALREQRHDRQLDRFLLAFDCSGDRFRRVDNLVPRRCFNGLS